MDCVAPSEIFIMIFKIPYLILLKNLYAVFINCNFLFCTLCCYAQNNDSSPIAILIGKQDHNIHQLFVPSTLIVAGTLSQISFRGSLNAELYKERNNNIPHFKTSADNYII